MTLPVQTYDQVFNQQSQAMQAYSGVPLDFSAGSVLGSLIASNAGNFLWLQALATSLLAITRLATCSGSDCDTFCADFNFFRFQGVPSNGQVTFTRATPSQVAIIFVGSIVSVSTVNNLTYQVTSDPTNPQFDAPLNGYVISIGVNSITVPITCQLQGTIGNVLAGQINTVNSIIPGVDSVSNAIAFTNGQNAWSDATFKAEFALYIQSLTRATGASINYIVSVTNAGVTNAPIPVRYLAVENFATNGITQQLGFFYVIVDDGTGIPNQNLINAVSQNVANYRGFTIAWTVIGPTQLNATISMGVKLIPNPTETFQTVQANIINAIQTFILSLSFNQTLYFTRIAQLAYDADPNVLDVTNVSLNSGSNDLVAFNTQLIFPAGITVSQI